MDHLPQPGVSLKNNTISNTEQIKRNIFFLFNFFFLSIEIHLTYISRRTLILVSSGVPIS